MIDVVEYDPTWPETFRHLRDRYRTALRSVPVVAIEHVGSTAVEGLAAKPVIDVDVVVAPADVPAATDALASIGFRPLGEQGIPGRWALAQPAHLPRTNTYVVEGGCLALRNHLAVRDVLRSDADLRAEYERQKRDLAARCTTTDAYVEGKSPVLRRVLATAGLGPDELDAIEDANRAP